MKKEMSAESKALTQKLWGYCKVLRDDGLTYGDYLEQLTYLLFLKMAHERTEPPRNEEPRIPEGYDWPSLVGLAGPELEAHYAGILTALAREPGLLGLIFRKAQNRVTDPANVNRNRNMHHFQEANYAPLGFDADQAEGRRPVA